jgi:hypothetical protein
MSFTAGDGAEDKCSVQARSPARRYPLDFRKDRFIHTFQYLNDRGMDLRDRNEDIFLTGACVGREVFRRLPLHLRRAYFDLLPNGITDPVADFGTLFSCEVCDLRLLRRALLMRDPMGDARAHFVHDVAQRSLGCA